ELRRMPAYLVPLREGRTIPIEKAVVFIGRHPECDVVLTRSRKISRKHCCVVQVDDHYLVRDLGSMNGVRINGRRVKTEAPLNFGDELAIADVHYQMRDRAESASKAVPRPAVAAPAADAPPSVDPSAKRTADAPSRPDLSDLSLEYPVPIAEESAYPGPHLVDAEDDVVPIASDSGQVFPFVDSGLDDEPGDPHGSSNMDEDAPNPLPDAAEDASDWNRPIVD
ncbi:MAG: FHA domain-containing protein, partial [Planctomycetaceae bacterium]